MKKRAFTKIWSSGAAKTTRYEKLSSSEAAVQMCSIKKVFLEILQNSQKNTCARVSFLIKLQALSVQLY